MGIHSPGLQHSTVDGASFLPREKTELEQILGTFLLEKAVYELAYELNNRPDWIIIPMTGIKQLLKE